MVPRTNHSAVLLLLGGGLFVQALLGVLRALVLANDHDYIVATFSVDPAPDIWLNLVLGATSALTIALLATRWRAIWAAAVAILLVGAVDALRLSTAPFGGAPFVELLALRLAVLYLIGTPLVRALFRMLPPHDNS